MGNTFGTTPAVGASLPVSWEEAKAHLRLDTADDEEYVTSLIAAATDYAEEAMSCTLMARARSATFYRSGPMYLAKGPLISITSITDDDDQVITDYDLEKVGNADKLTINVGFTYPVTVVYQAGYASAAAVPASIRQVILMDVATMYENRETVSERPRTPVPRIAEFYRLKGRGVLVA